MNILFWDVETNNFKQNRIFQLAFEIASLSDGETTAQACCFIRPNGWALDDNGYHKGRFTHQQCYEEGLRIEDVLPSFLNYWAKSDLIVAHNISFDLRMLQGECAKQGLIIPPCKTLCTMQTTRDITRIPNKDRGGYKPPTLTELHQFLFRSEFQGGHSADVDVAVLKKCFFELVNKKLLTIPSIVA